MWIDNEKIIEIYNKLNDKNIKFPCECPNCKRNTSHLYIHKHNERHCGIWLWCSECGAFAHLSGTTPNWWKTPEFIDKNELCSDPSYLERKVVEIDEWVNSIVSSKTSDTQTTFIEDRFNVKFKIDIYGIQMGTEGVLVVKNDLETTKVEFVYKSGEIVDILLSYEELLNAIEIL